MKRPATRRAAAARLPARLGPRPRILFVGINPGLRSGALTVYQQFFARRASGGPGPKPERIHGARVFVVPNPSGRNAAFPGFRDKLLWYRRLRRWAESADAAGREPPHGVAR